MLWSGVGSVGAGLSLWMHAYPCDRIGVYGDWLYMSDLYTDPDIAVRKRLHGMCNDRKHVLQGQVIGMEHVSSQAPIVDRFVREQRRSQLSYNVSVIGLQLLIGMVPMIAATTK